MKYDMSKKKIFRNPQGSKDWLPDEVRKQDFIRESLFSVFELWGYQPIQTPILINRDTLGLGSKNLLNQAFSLIGHQGELLALRADLTTPIARATAERMQNEKLPLRFYYVGKVFRAKARKTTNERELYQIGTELIGAKEGNSDFECLKIFLDSLDKLGLKNYLVLVNHAGFWNELIEKYGDFARDLYFALSHKDIVQYKNTIKNSKITKDEKIFFSKLVSIKGGKEILPQIKSVSKKCKKINFNKIYNYYENLFNVFDKNIQVDFSFTNDIDYYSGIYFEALSPVLGRSVGGGGRYDDLISKFGFNVPAIGFSFCLEDLLLVLENEGKTFSKTGNVKSIDPKKNLKEAFLSIGRLHKSKTKANIQL